mmetsp:Transcript_64454/g.143999  ORF Transcript_64454/g.143999 Transcript_64454/m.143999 type:complete len:204 (-) Transcript_64454:591-1202(-)
MRERGSGSAHRGSCGSPSLGFAIPRPRRPLRRRYPRRSSRPARHLQSRGDLRLVARRGVHRGITSACHQRRLASRFCRRLTCGGWRVGGKPQVCPLPIGRGNGGDEPPAASRGVEPAGKGQDAGGDDWALRGYARLGFYGGRPTARLALVNPAPHRLHPCRRGDVHAHAHTVTTRGALHYHARDILTWNAWPFLPLPLCRRLV